MVDVAVVGAGPNGLAAAVVMARAGLSVHLYEAADAIGGGSRTSELIEPGYLYDVCSAVHPMAVASPFFRDFELSQRVDLRLPEVQHGTPLDIGGAALAYQSLDRTVAGAGRRRAGLPSAAAALAGAGGRGGGLYVQPTPARSKGSSGGGQVWSGHPGSGDPAVDAAIPGGSRASAVDRRDVTCPRLAAGTQFNRCRATAQRSGPRGRLGHSCWWIDVHRQGNG